MSQYLECDSCKGRINSFHFHIKLEMEGKLLPKYGKEAFFDQDGYAHLCRTCSNNILEILKVATEEKK